MPRHLLREPLTERDPPPPLCAAALPLLPLLLRRSLLREHRLLGEREERVVDGQLLVCEFARAHVLVAGSLKVLVARAFYGISTFLLLCEFARVQRQTFT
jgi:hypothetical protein